MKKIVILGVVSTMLLLPMAACAKVGNDDAMTESTLDITNLLFGTLRLEGTDLALSPEMASELLPLWQAARTIYTSDASAAEEQQAILRQIIEVMTAEQVAAIEDMDLASEGMGQAMREMMGTALPEGSEGFIFSGEPPEGLPEMPQGFVFGEQGEPRGRPEGVPNFQGGEGFIGGPGFAEGISPEARATVQAERGGRQGMRLNTGLFDILIELLQERAGEE